MKPKKCCGKYMDFKNVVTRISAWELFFQCKKCKEIEVIKVDEYIKGKHNNKLLNEEGVQK